MNFDLSPLYRSTVGYDSLVSMLDQIADYDNEATTYQPYNIEASHRERVPHHHGGRRVRQGRRRDRGK